MVKHEPDKNRAFALRSAWFEPGTSSYFGAMRYQTAGDWPTFKAALSHWGAAPMNFAYADVHGDIAMRSRSASRPSAATGTGCCRCRATAATSGTAFATPDELPEMVNPARGWVASANELHLPDGHVSRARNLGCAWADPGRMQRIDATRCRRGPM